MKKRHIAFCLLTVTGLGLGVAAYVATPTIHEGAAGEAPELGRYGDFAVGTMEQDFTLSEGITFGKLATITGQVETADRALKVRFWYPAEVANGEALVTYQHTMRPPAMEPIALEFQGRSFVDAPPKSNDQQYPLVIMSHGFNGWSTQFSNLGEHIASRGYVVASIDHADMQIGGVTDFLHSFQQVIVNRTLDQRGVLNKILADARIANGLVSTLIDTENVGLIGYSMGGYGALATAGAAYNMGSDTIGNVPENAREALENGMAEDVEIDALIAFAPWGGQPDNRVWTQQSLAQIDIPTLIVSGDQDDIVNYADGVRWIFDSLTGGERHLLTFREARHNTVGNAFKLPEDAPFRAAEFLNEPVWRQDRINAINQHFVTAFLDLHLKGDEAKARFLKMPVRNANDSEWPIRFGEQLNGKLAGADQSEHWPGFQRRWALGLEFETRQAGE